MSEELTEADRRALLAAQYQNDDEDEDIGGAAGLHTFRPNEQMAILADGTQVPTLIYVQRLEQLVRQQQKSLDRLQRELARLNSAVARQRQSLNLHSSRIGDMGRELDSKIDRRHDF